MSSVLSVNGSRLTFDVNQSWIIMEPNILTQLIKFEYNSSDKGFYIQQLSIHDYYLYLVLRDQGYRCMDHFRYTDRLHLFSVSLIAFPFILSMLLTNN